MDAAQPRAQRRALLLDRDGIINVDSGYVHTTERFVWQNGIIELIARAHRNDLIVVVVTNQSGIGRGYYTTEQFEFLTRWMCHQLSAQGAPIARVYHCPYHPDANLEYYRNPDHHWRKPNPGMLFAARDELDIDLSGSVMVGDKWSDMIAGHAAGVGRLVLVGSVPGEMPESPPTVSRFASVADAARWLVLRGGLTNLNSVVSGVSA